MRRKNRNYLAEDGKIVYGGIEYILPVEIEMKLGSITRKYTLQWNVWSKKGLRFYCKANGEDVGFVEALPDGRMRSHLRGHIDAAFSQLYLGEGILSGKVEFIEE